MKTSPSFSRKNCSHISVTFGVWDSAILMNITISMACAGNSITQSFFLPITLIACMVGLASVLAGVHHMRLFRSDSLAAAAAASLIAWLLVLLAMGYYSLSPPSHSVGSAGGGQIEAGWICETISSLTVSCTVL